MLIRSADIGAFDRAAAARTIAAASLPTLGPDGDFPGRNLLGRNISQDIIGLLLLSCP
jgi:hypothetical protein